MADWSSSCVCIYTESRESAICESERASARKLCDREEAAEQEIFIVLFCGEV